MAITSFRGTVFSNFSAVKGGVLLDEVAYPTVEHAYQAAKTLDEAKRLVIRSLLKAGDAKKAGRKLKIRDDWEDVKVDVMRVLLVQKFRPGSWEAGQLEATRDEELIEVNTWGDRFWGECPRGTGENHLGKLLMEIREMNRRAR